jgi:predicted transcriptional regulator
MVTIVTVGVKYLTNKNDSQILLSPEKQFIHGDAFNRGFVQMPRMIVACIGLSAQAKGVYNFIANYVYEHGRSAFPSVHRIAIACNMTAKSVVKHIGELVEKGFIKKVRRGRGRTNDYYVKDAHEVGILRVSEMLWTALDNALRKVEEGSWEKVHDAFTVLTDAMQERRCSFHDLVCTEEVREAIEADLVTIMKGGKPALAFIPKVKSKTPTAQPTATTGGAGKKPHYLQRDESTWRTDEFIDYFYRKYLDLTGSPHTVTKTVHRAIIVRMLKQLDENKHDLRKYIDAFFEIGYDNKSLEWFGTSGRAAEIALYLKEGKKPFYIDNKERTNKKQKEVEEAQQEYKGIDPNAFIKRLRGEA